MLDYIHLYQNPHEKEFNMDFLESTFDKSMDAYVIEWMHDFETIKNIKILDYTIVEDQDDIDINAHMININYKKKNLDEIVVPKYKYMLQSRYHEIVFRIQIKTNLHEKVITKRILVPSEYYGNVYIDGRKMKIIWQLVDASTYSQRGRVTMKSRNPIAIYGNNHRVIPDIYGTEFVVPAYSYAQVATKSKYSSTKKQKPKFIEPLLMFLVKLGCKKTIKYFGMEGIVKIKKSYTKKDECDCYIFECNDVYIIVIKELFEAFDLVKSFVAMFYRLQNRDFPVTSDVLEDKEYWICRIGYIGSMKNKNIYSFYEKGKTCVHKIERLLEKATSDSLRLPDIYKGDIYRILYWIMTNYDFLKQRENIDMANKRIRKNEVIVGATLGKKISENINKLIERKSKSKLNTMDTLLELFNFNSDIIVNGMKNMNDMVKSNDGSNDMAFLNKFAFTAKGYQSLGEKSSKMIADKYRYLHPSMVGVIDLFTTSNSDCGMSGSIVPFVKLYDGFFFTPEGEPCKTRYEFEKALKEDFGIDRGLPLDTFEEYIEYLTKKNEFAKEFEYETIEIVEKEEETPKEE